jgi:hypothetical protein
MPAAAGWTWTEVVSVVEGVAVVAFVAPVVMAVLLSEAFMALMTSAW